MKNRRIGILAFWAFAALLFLSCAPGDEERSHILKIYNWADYIDEGVLSEFPA